MKRVKLNEAYGHMCGLILSGIEFTVAHEETVLDYDLTDAQSRKLITMYDEDNN